MNIRQLDSSLGDSDLSGSHIGTSSERCKKIQLTRYPDIMSRQINTNGSPGLGGLLGELGPLLGGGLGGGLRRDDEDHIRRQLDAVTGLLSAVESLLKGLGLGV